MLMLAPAGEWLRSVAAINDDFDDYVMMVVMTSIMLIMMKMVLMIIMIIWLKMKMMIMTMTMMVGVTNYWWWYCGDAVTDRENNDDHDNNDDCDKLLATHLSNDADHDGNGDYHDHEDNNADNDKDEKDDNNSDCDKLLGTHLSTLSTFPTTRLSARDSWDIEHVSIRIDTVIDIITIISPSSLVIIVNISSRRRSQDSWMQPDYYEILKQIKTTFDHKSQETKTNQ